MYKHNPLSRMCGPAPVTQNKPPVKRQGPFVSSFLFCAVVVFGFAAVMSVGPLLSYIKEPHAVSIDDLLSIIVVIGGLFFTSLFLALFIYEIRKDNPPPPPITFSDICTDIREIGKFLVSFLKALPFIIGVLVVLAIIIGLIVALFENAPWWAAVIILLLVIIIIR